MKPLVAAVAVLVALAVGAQAQTPDTGALRTRAEQGDVAAQWALGFRYEYGRGAPQDAAEAARWYRLAAEQGYISGPTSLEVIYPDGRSGAVPKDHVDAARWYRLAAEQGDADAQFNLGAMYGRIRPFAFFYPDDRDDLDLARPAGPRAGAHVGQPRGLTRPKGSRPGLQRNRRPDDP